MNLYVTYKNGYVHTYDNIKYIRIGSEFITVELKTANCEGKRGLIVDKTPVSYVEVQDDES